MNLQEQKTWQTLQNLAIDDKCASFKFSDRLAKENGWSKKFALQCIEEYKKFVFLAKHAGHPVTPSLEVDEAWHLHMIYTRSYWEEMCKEIDFQLHHGPTKGGKVEEVKFTDWYAKTKDSYRKFFGEPPIMFWPSSEIRFTPQDIVKVNRKSFFLFRRPKLGKRTAVISCTTLPLVMLFVITDITSAWILVGILGIIAIAIIIGIVRRNNREKEEQRVKERRVRENYLNNNSSLRNGSVNYSSYKSKSSSNRKSDKNDLSSTGGCSTFFPASSCSSGCSSESNNSHSDSSSDSSGCSSSSSGCSSGSSGCGSSCGGGCGG